MSARSAGWSLALLTCCSGLSIASAAAPGVAAAPDAAAAARAVRATPTPTSMARAAIAAIDACVPRLDPELDVGFSRIATLCPALASALEASGVAVALPADWKRPRNELSAGGLRALRRALAERGTESPRRAPPDTGALAQLVRASQASTAAAAGPWARFSRWLRARVEGVDPRADRPGLLSRFRDLTLPQRVWSVLGYAAVLALLLFAAGIVRAELRAAGWLGAAPLASRAAPTTAPSLQDDGSMSIAAVPVFERPAWLLRRLAATLQRLGRLPPPGHLTPREVARVALFDDPGERGPLQAIAEAAERVRFGATPPALLELEPTVAAAAALLQRLDSAVTAGAGAGRA